MVVRGGGVVVCEEGERGWGKDGRAGQHMGDTSGLSVYLSVCLFRLIHVLVQQAVALCSCRHFIVYICTLLQIDRILYIQI